MIIFQNLSRVIIPSEKKYIDSIITRVITQINELYIKIMEIKNDINDFSVFGFGLSLSIDEALKNAIEHGNKNNTNKLIQMEYYIDSEKITVKIRDQGKGFNYLPYLNMKKKSEFDVENIEERGRGILLIKNFMDEVKWNNSGNEIIMIKYRK